MVLGIGVSKVGAILIGAPAQSVRGLLGSFPLELADVGDDALQLTSAGG